MEGLFYVGTTDGSLILDLGPFALRRYARLAARYGCDLEDLAADFLRDCFDLPEED